MTAVRMWKCLVLCASCLVSWPGALGSLSDELTETTQLCCSKGEQYARTHSAEDCSSSVPPDVPPNVSSFCLFSMDFCCKDYFRKKRECDNGMDLATSLKNCDSTKDIAKKCCNQCLKGTSAGVSSGEGACRRDEHGNSEVLLTTDAFSKCCQNAARAIAHNETSVSHQRHGIASKDFGDDELFSVCDEYAPTELCAHHCIPVPGSYRCVCNPGFRLMADKRNCIEVVNNRCKPKNPCEHKCNDDGVEVKCSCRRGYELMPDRKSCQDINECALEPAVCLAEHKCYNLQGSYKCVPELSEERGQCPPGYRRNIANSACDDINECELLHPPCPSYLCENTVGGYKCGGVAGNPVNLANIPRTITEERCPQGFRTGLNEDCEDVNECAIQKDNCNPLSQFCINTRGSFHCQDRGSKFCPAGFKIDPATSKCEDIDECEHEQDLCPTEHVCVNTLGEYDCKSRDDVTRNENQCPDGMRMIHGRSLCEDIDECVEGIHMCDPNQNCLNTNGSYECTCRLGFKMDPDSGVCSDVNECATGQHDCISESQRCDNTVGSFLCVRILSCGTGYILQHSTGLCEDIDECLLGTHDCPPVYKCINIPGTFNCIKRSTTTSTSTTEPSDYEEYYDSDEDLDESNKATEQSQQVDKNTITENPKQILETRSETTPVVPVTHFDQPTNTISPSTEKISQVEQRIADQNPDENSIDYESNNIIPQQPSYNAPTEAITPTQTEISTESNLKSKESSKESEQTYTYEPKGPPIQIDQTYPNEPREPLKPTEESYPYDPREPPTDPNIIYIQEKQAPTNDSLTERIGFGQDETTFNPIIVTEPEITTPTFVLMRPGKETATVRGEKTEDGAVVVNTKNVPKNEWTKINEKPSDCHPGFERDESGACFDVDECATHAHSCSGLTESCHNTMGGYICECVPGFRRDLATGDCTFVIVTSTSTTVPPPPTTTENDYFWGYPDRRHYTSRPFRPRTLCDAGYHLNSNTGICEDINECTNGQANCAAVEVCVNTEGGYRCECPPNWRLDEVKHRCAPRVARGNVPHGYGNQPAAPPTNPSVVHRHVPTAGKYEPEFIDVGKQGSIVNCPWGYRLGYDNVCEDIDECLTGTAKCGPQQVCVNSPGGYTCSCPSGFKLVGDHLCEDVDECRLAGARPICSQNAKCINTVGSYRCQCNEGFSPAPANDKVCVDIDECVGAHGTTLCQHRCNNVWGGYRCSCHRGYRLTHDNKTCTDVDECVEYKSKMLCIGHCLNEPGGYRCTCPQGYRLSEDRKSCIDINECENGEAPCAKGGVLGGVSDVCLNTRGGYRCHRIACPTGYQLEDKHRCKRTEQYCEAGDWECAHQPTTYSYNFITFVSNLYIPDNKVDLFTMRGPKWPFAKMKFRLRLVNVNAPPTVKEKANIDAFLLVQSSAEQAMVSLTRPLQGPQSVELELAMELYNQEQFGGIAVAKIFIYVSEHEF